MSHTPGPWTNHDGIITPRDEYRHTYPDGSKNSVATVWNHYKSAGEFTANAELIASAPNLKAHLSQLSAERDTWKANAEREERNKIDLIQQLEKCEDDLKAMTEERNRLARMLDDRGVCYE